MFSTNLLRSDLPVPRYQCSLDTFIIDDFSRKIMTHGNILFTFAVLPTILPNAECMNEPITIFIPENGTEFGAQIVGHRTHLTLFNFAKKIYVEERNEL